MGQKRLRVGLKWVGAGMGQTRGKEKEGGEGSGSGRRKWGFEDWGKREREGYSHKNLSIFHFLILPPFSPKQESPLSSPLSLSLSLSANPLSSTTRFFLHISKHGKTQNELSICNYLSFYPTLIFIPFILWLAFFLYYAKYFFFLIFCW